MAIYTPVNDFSAKDNLATGNPEKIILGSDMDAETAAIQTAITTAAATAIPEGTDMLFYQAAAPTGWVKDTTSTLNNTALRVTTGDGAALNNTDDVGFTTAFASQTPAGTIASTTVTIPSATGSTSITEAQMPAHYHFVIDESIVTIDTVSTSQSVAGEMDEAGGDTQYDLGGSNSAADAGRSSTVGSGDGHTHSIAAATAHNHTATFSGTALDLEVNYLNVIICYKSAY